MGKGVPYRSWQQTAILAALGCAVVMLAAYVLTIPTAGKQPHNPRRTAAAASMLTTDAAAATTSSTSTTTATTPPKAAQQSDRPIAHVGGDLRRPSHPLDVLAVVRRATARMSDRQACPWEMMETWAAMSRRASETVDATSKLMFFMHNRDGPGYGVTLAIEVAAIIIAMLGNRPLRSIPKAASDAMPGFNARGELIGSSWLDDWFHSRPFVLKNDFRMAEDGTHTRYGAILLTPNSSQDDIRIPELRFGIRTSLTKDYGWTLRDRKVLRNFSVASMLEEYRGPVVISSGDISSDGLPFFFDFLISPNNTSPRERAISKELGARKSDFAAPQCVLRFLLDQPSTSVKDLLYDALKGIGEKDILVSIHLRRGDYVMGQECSTCVNAEDPESQNGEERMSMEWVKRSLLKAKRNIVDRITAQGRKVVVFLASDTIDVVSVAKKVFEDVRNIPGNPTHTSQMSGDSDQRTAAAFWGLALGDVCVRCVSTFGGMAIEMSGCEDFVTEISPSEALSGRDLDMGLSEAQIRKLLRTTDQQRTGLTNK
eukprot:CAMPEP_0170193680 /NCGR_PEP_ID=MMETSP0040_2-20121228/57420_1 /TAXON_ID=641309 /ORGANISM="Lotharella oceanica, Strain CCMP622" /LENGTH=540 /DNA_ID=CAMNT_0010442385 /DNA_START=48 /DNA_END=1670 /DNA_ORIENTATION=-